MRVLLTGGSSFTGLWFARSLAAAGWTVVAPLKSAVAKYSGLRAERVAELGRVAEIVANCPFGEKCFNDLVKSRTWDLFCQHAAKVSDYRSPDFDVVGAVAENTNNLVGILKALCAQGCGAMILTGSVFEQDEGSGSAPLRAFSPYGLSKSLTWQIYRYYCGVVGLRLGKFVIPNPFGPYEEPRFCSYLIQGWLKGETPAVRTPLYVRDNIHVGMLGMAYVAFAADVCSQPATLRFNPSGYVESQAAFAHRLAAEMAPRLGVRCPVKLLDQTDFDEPLVRVNTERADRGAIGWDETAAWDAIANYYKTQPSR